LWQRWARHGFNILWFQLVQTVAIKAIHLRERDSTPRAVEEKNQQGRKTCFTFAGI
jgi:hypothetical protein